MAQALRALAYGFGSVHLGLVLEEREWSTARISLFLTAAVAGLAMLLVGAAEAGQAFDAIRARGSIVCGVNQGVAGFSAPDSRGEYRGLDADFCRALAAAVFSDPTKVRFVPTSSQNRFTMLQSGEIDVLARNATQTLQRDTALGLNMAGVNFYDGQGFLVRRSLGLASARQLDGATICAAVLTSVPLGVNTAIAVAAHEIPQEVGDVAILLASGYSRRRALLLNGLSAAAGIGGTLLAFMTVGALPASRAYILALSSASLLYIAMSDLIPGLHRGHTDRSALQQVLLIAAGIGTVVAFEALIR